MFQHDLFICSLPCKVAKLSGLMTTKSSSLEFLRKAQITQIRVAHFSMWWMRHAVIQSFLVSFSIKLVRIMQLSKNSFSSDIFCDWILKGKKNQIFYSFIHAKNAKNNFQCKYFLQLETIPHTAMCSIVQSRQLLQAQAIMKFQTHLF